MEANYFSQNCKKYFFCKICDYKTTIKKDYDKHLITAKHKRLTNFSHLSHTDNNTIHHHNCECGKKYIHASSLCKHKKICKRQNIPITPEIIVQIIQQNKELQQMLKDQQQSLIDQNKTIVELSKHTGGETNNYINNNNRTFNLQIYLNETCKGAINLSEFVNKMQLSISDLEKIGEAGYAEGISKVFIKHLNDINVEERPLHCTDYKRETLYIKDNDQWTKDDDEKTVLTKAIKQVTNKNINQIFEWQKLHPEYQDPESKQNDQYLKIVMNSMPGSTTEETNKNYEKIVKNIIKKTIIEK